MRETDVKKPALWQAGFVSLDAARHRATR